MDFRDNIKKRKELMRKMQQFDQMNEYRENQRKMNSLNTAKRIGSYGNKAINMGDNLKNYGKTLDTVGNKLAGSSNGFASNIGNFSKDLGKNFTDAGNKVDLLKGNITKNVSNTNVGEAGKAIGNKLGEAKGAIGKGFNTVGNKAMNSVVGQGLQKAGGKLAQSALGQGLKAGAGKLAASAAGKALTGLAGKAIGLATGPVGWAVMGAKMIYDMVKSAKQKRDQKAMAQAQKLSEEALVNKKQQNANLMQEGMENQTELQNKMANIKNEMDQRNLEQQSGYQGTLPEIANYQNKNELEEYKKNINPEDYRTALTPEEQGQFDSWVTGMRNKGAIHPQDRFQDYDMQGYWKNEVLNNTNLSGGNVEDHFTDKYKMPNHETFSNESQYYNPDNAKYAGSWDGDKYIQPIINQGEQQMNPENQGLINKLIGAIRGEEYSPGQAAPVIQPQAPIQGPTLDPNAGVAQAQEPNLVQSIMGKIKGGMDNLNIGQGLQDMNAGYQDNVNTSFTQGDLYNRLSSGQLPDESVKAGEQVVPNSEGVVEGGTVENDPKVSNIMSKIGELAGTAQRTLSRPMVQGAIATGISAANGNDLGSALEYGFNWGKDKAISDRYRSMIDPDATPSLLGGYTSSDYNSYLSNEGLKDKRETEAYNRTRNAEKDAWQKEKEQKDLDLREKEFEAKKNAGYYTRGYGRNNTRQAGYSNPRNDKYELENLIRQRDDAKAQNDERAVNFYQNQINQMGGYTPEEQPIDNTSSQGGNWISNIIDSIKQQGKEAQKNIDTSNYVVMEAPGQGRRLVPANQIEKYRKLGATIVNG